MKAVDVWAELENEVRPTGPGSIRRRIGPKAPCDIFLAIELPSDKPMLVMTVPAALALQLQGGEWSLGVEADLVTLGDGQTDVCLKLADRRFLDIFGRLADDIIEAVTTQGTPEAALHEFGSRFVRWQRFLERAHPDGLSFGAQMGLFGELWALHEVLVRHVPLMSAVESWVGPLGANQDYQLSGLALEVKCTSTKLPLKVRIQSERQLDDTGVDALFLVILVLDVREGREATLAQMVSQLRDDVSADGAAAAAFEDRLFQMGYFDAHRERYSHRSYSIREVHVCRVTEGFPRIIPRQLGAGVGDIRYSVGLVECLPHEVEMGDLVAALGATHAPHS